MSAVEVGFPSRRVSRLGQSYRRMTVFSMMKSACLCAVVLLFLFTFSSGTAHAVLLRDLESAVLLRSRSGIPVRQSGEAYAVDAALFLLYAVESGNRALFDELLPPFRQAFIVSFEGGAHTSGMVGWKRRAQEPPDASGTTETILAAKALWRAGVLWKMNRISKRVFRLYGGILLTNPARRKAGRSETITTTAPVPSPPTATLSDISPTFCSKWRGAVYFWKRRRLRTVPFASSGTPLCRMAFFPALSTLNCGRSSPKSEFSYHFSPDFPHQTGRFRVHRIGDGGERSEHPPQNACVC